MKVTVFWDIAPSSAVQIDDHPDDGGRKHLWNVCQFLPDYTAQHPTVRTWYVKNNCKVFHLKLT
jgi:hypothetical protein